jgi:ArsR family transcriptional regulator, arsenate/arsenite/antimonite-responsive transcriptional repressor
MPDITLQPLPMIDTCECGDPTSLQLGKAEAEAWAARFKALAHPVRLQLLDILSRQETQVCVCELEAHFDLTQPTISHHLKILRDAGIIASEQRGLWVYHHVERAVLDDLQGFLTGLR